MIDHYRGLFDRHQWLEDALCWTVVQPIDEETRVDDLLRRLNGGRDPQRQTMEYPTEEAFTEDQPVFFAFVEASTGMRLESEWLDVEEAPVIIFDTWYQRT